MIWSVIVLVLVGLSYAAIQLLEDKSPDATAARPWPFRVSNPLKIAAIALFVIVQGIAGAVAISAAGASERSRRDAETKAHEATNALAAKTDELLKYQDFLLIATGLDEIRNSVAIGTDAQTQVPLACINLIRDTTVNGKPALRETLLRDNAAFLHRIVSSFDGWMLERLAELDRQDISIDQRLLAEQVQSPLKQAAQEFSSITADEDLPRCALVLQRVLIAMNAFENLVADAVATHKQRIARSFNLIPDANFSHGDTSGTTLSVLGQHGASSNLPKELETSGPSDLSAAAP